MADQLISMTLTDKGETVITTEEALVTMIEIDVIGVAEIEGDPLHEGQGDRTRGPVPGHVINALEVTVDRLAIIALEVIVDHHVINALEVIVDHHVTSVEVLPSHQSKVREDHCRQEDAQIHLIGQDQDPGTGVIE